MKRDAKIELIRTSIAHEISLLEHRVQRPGRQISDEQRPAVLFGLRRAVEILDRVDEETR